MPTIFPSRSSLYPVFLLILKAEHISSIFIISGESLSITLYASFPDIFIYMPPVYFIYPLVKPAASLCVYIYLLRWTLSSKPRLTSASQGYGRVSFSAVWLLMPVRHKPLSRLTGCGRLIRIIAPPVPLFSATRTVGSPLYSIRGREEVSLCPRRLIAPCLPHRDDEMRLSLGLCHLRAASSAAPPHGICTRKLVWNCQCSKKEKNPFTNNQVLGGKD